jgi:catechol-2,3-dioxygenase
LRKSAIAIDTSASGPLAKARVDGVFLYMREFLTMLAFYRDTLGFAVAYASEHFASLRTSEGAELELHGGREKSGGEANHWFLHVTVDDIETVAAALRGRGVAVGEIRE